MDASVGCWTLYTGRWTLDSEHWTLDSGRWTLDAERWTEEVKTLKFQKLLQALKAMEIY